MTLRDDTLPHPEGTRTGIDAADADTGTPDDDGVTNPGATTTGAAYGLGGADAAADQLGTGGTAGAGGNVPGPDESTTQTGAP